MRLCALLFVAPLLLGACGHGRWMASESGRVTVYTEAKIEHAHIQQWLELSHDAYRALFPEVSFDKVDVLWLRKQPGEGTHVRRPNEDPASGWTLETVPSRGPIGKDGLIVLERREQYVAGGGGFGFTHYVRDEGLAKRQMAHLFIMKAAGGNAPLWLQVGLARYMAKFRMHYRGSAWVVCFGSAAFDEPPQISTTTGRRVIIPVHDVVTGDWYDYDRTRRYWFEYTAYALVHFLIHGENGFNASRFPLFMRAIRDRKGVDEALGLAYPNILPQEWDEKLAAHVRPPANRAIIAGTDTVAQGLCHRLRGQYNADIHARTRAADPRAVDTVLEDLARVDLFRRHAGWMPADVVDAEAAKRPGRGKGQRPGGTGPRGDDRGAERDEFPTIRSP